MKEPGQPASSGVFRPDEGLPVAARLIQEAMGGGIELVDESVGEYHRVILDGAAFSGEFPAPGSGGNWCRSPPPVRLPYCGIPWRM